MVLGFSYVWDQGGNAMEERKKESVACMYDVGDEMKKNGNLTFKVPGISIYLY